jgi:hypothetical protein
MPARIDGDGGVTGRGNGECRAARERAVGVAGRGVGVGRGEERVHEAGDVEEVPPQLGEVVPDAAQAARHPSD